MKYAALPSSTMLISIIGFFASVFLITDFSSEFGFTFALLFIIMFIASLLSMTFARPKDLLAIDEFEKTHKHGKILTHKQYLEMLEKQKAHEKPKKVATTKKVTTKKTTPSKKAPAKKKVTAKKTNTSKKPVDYKSKTVAELKTKATKLKLTGISRLNKADLIKKIKAAERKKANTQKGTRK